MSVSRAHAIAPATPETVRHICTHLRPLDAAEVAALHNIPQEDVPGVILRDWQRHDEAFVLMRGATPLCLFGATPHAELDAAFIWMIGSTDVRAKELLRYGRTVIDDYLRRYADLFCLVWSGHRVSLAWLKHLGFHRGNSVRVMNSEFILMVKHKEVIACATPLL